MDRSLLSDIQEDTSTTSIPPLPPELWNFVVIVVICGLMGWSIRVINLLLMYMEARSAACTDAVLHLKNLGPSISVLENASLRHLQHLLRTKVEPSITKMKRMDVPVDIISSSLQVIRTGVANERSLSFTFRSKVPCTVQIMWDVKKEALDHTQPATVSIHNDSDRTLPTVLERISVRRSFRAFPSLFSRVRRQNRRHELRDEVVNASDRSRPLGLCGRFHEDDFTQQSDVQRFNCVEVCTFSASMPTVVADTLRQESDSVIDSDHSTLPSSTVMPTTALVRPRYSAVVVIRTIPLSTPPTSSSDSTLMGKIGIGRRRNSNLASHSTFICQYLAIDLLPTPSKQDCFTPVIVKTINCTNSQAFVTQEVYGHVHATSSECAICLEGVVSVVLLPCRHFCVCQVCLEEIDRCPICRTKFTTYVYSINEALNNNQEAVASTTDVL